MFCWNLPIDTEGIIKDADTTISLWMIEVITLVLAEVYTMPQDWGNLFFKLSLAEALEEVATRVAEEAWLYNEYAFYFCFDYIHDSNLSSYIRFSKTYPQWSLHPLRFPRSRGTETFLTLKEGSTFLTKPLFPQGREDVAGYAIASARVLVSAAEPLPTRGCR